MPFRDWICNCGQTDNGRSRAAKPYFLVDDSLKHIQTNHNCIQGSTAIDMII